MLASGDFSPVFLRNATVYGVSPMLRFDLVVNNLTGYAFTTGEIVIKSDGTPWRPLIHVKDISCAFIATLKAPRQLIHNQVFNVGESSQNYQIKDIAEIIKKILPSCNVIFTGEHGSDSRTYKVDFSKIKNALGKYFQPSWNVKRGVEELIESFKNHSLKKEEFFSNKFTRLKRIHYLLQNQTLDKKLFWKEGATP